MILLMIFEFHLLKLCQYLNLQYFPSFSKDTFKMKSEFENEFEVVGLSPGNLNVPQVSKVDGNVQF